MSHIKRGAIRGAFVSVALLAVVGLLIGLLIAIVVGAAGAVVGGAIGVFFMLISPFRKGSDNPVVD